MEDKNFSMYDDPDVMIFPESIDDLEPPKTSYMFTTTKLILMFVGILPLVIMAVLLLSDYGFVPFVVFTILYLIIYSWFFRMYVVEEPKQRESLNTLEDNKISGYPLFWDISKAGTSDKDNGLLYLRQDGAVLKRAYVIKFDSGSIVGVPDDFLELFRHTEQEFLQGLQYDFKWYSIQKRPTINNALKHQSILLKDTENDELAKLIKMQLNTYLRYSMDSEQRYVNYIIVINSSFEKMSSFRTSLEDLLSRTLKTNASFKNVEILDKDGLDDFIANYYMQNLVDISTIRKISKTKPFSNYAKVLDVVDEDGQSVPMEIIDQIEREIAQVDTGLTFEQIIERDEKKEEKLEASRLRQKEVARKQIVSLRQQDLISFEEYKERIAELENTYSPENFIPNRAEYEKEMKRLEKEKERLKKRKEKEDSLKEKERLAEEANKKWFEKEEYNDTDIQSLNTETIKKRDIGEEDFRDVLNIPTPEDDLQDSEEVEEIDIYKLLSDDED